MLTSMTKIYIKFITSMSAMSDHGRPIMTLTALDVVLGVLTKSHQYIYLLGVRRC